MSTRPVSSEALLTADEFWELPESPEGGRMELVGGRVVTEMPVGRLHAKLAARLARAIGDFVDRFHLGETHVELGHRTKSSPDSVRAPDVSYVSQARLVGMPQDGFVESSPTLAVEIMSPNDRESEVAAKVEEYFDSGAERVWIVRPRNKTITVHRPGGDAHTFTVRDTLSSTDAAFSVDGFALGLAELFAD